RARGVGRGVDEHRLAERGEPAGELARAALEAIRLPGGCVHALAAGVADQIGIHGVARVSQEHFVAGVEQSREEEEHGRGGSRGDEDLLGGDGDAVSRVVVLGDGLAQRQETQAVRISRAPVLEGLLGRLPDDGRGVEVRLTELEVDDVLALPLELLGTLEDLHGEEGLDDLRTLRRHGVARPRQARRMRARTIWASMRGPSRSTSTLDPGWSAQLIATSITR